MALSELIVSIVGDMSKLSETLNKVQGDLANQGKSLESFGKSLSSAGESMTKGITVPILAGGAAMGVAVKDGMEFEKGMAQVYTLLPDMSQTAFGKLQQDTLQFSKDMKVPTEQVLPALYDAIGSGVPVDNVFSFLEVAQKGAVAGVTTVGVAVDTLTSLMNAYGAENLSAAEASDILFTGMNYGKMSFEELQSSLYKVVPTAASLGVPLGDITAALATMTAQGTPTAQATTQITRLLAELSKEGTSASDTFKQIAGKSFPQFIAEGGNLEDAIKLLGDGFISTTPQAKELQDKMYELADPTSGLAQEFEALSGKTFKQFQQEGGTSQQALEMLGLSFDDTNARISDTFGSIEAGNAVLQLTGRGAELFSDNMEAMANSAGATDEAYNKMSQTLSFAFDGMVADVKNASTELGLKLIPVLRDTIVPLITDTFIPAMETAVDVIGTVAEWFNKLPQPVKLAAVGFVAFLAALGPILVVVGTVVSSIGTLAAALGTGGALSVAFIAVKGLILGFIGTLGTLAAPILAIVAVIAVLALAWKNNWFDIQGKAQTAYDILKTTFSNLKTFLENLYNGIITATGNLKTNVTTLWNLFATVFSTNYATIVAAVNGLYTGLQNKYNQIIAGAQALYTQIKAQWDNIKITLSTAFSDILNLITTWVSNQATKLSTALTGITTFKDQALARWAEVKAGIVARFNEMVADITIWVTNQTSKLTAALSSITTFKDQALARWAEVKAGIVARFNEMVADITAWVTNQTAKLTAAITSINNFRTQALARWAEVKAGIVARFNEMVADAQAWVTNQTAKLTAAINSVVNFKNQVLARWAEIKAGILAKLNEVINDFQAWINNQQAKLNDLLNKLNNFKSQVVARWNEIKASIKQALDQIVSDIIRLTGNVTSALDGMVSAIKKKASEFYNAGANIVQNLIDGISSKITAMKKKISELTSLISSYLPMNSPSLVGALSKLPKWDDVVSKPVVKSLQSAASSAKAAGANIVNSIASGVKSAASSVTSAISSVTKKVRSYLPFSPAEVGPFSELPNWDSVFYDPLLDSIKKTEQLVGPLQQALSRIENPLSSFEGGFDQLSNLGTVVNNAGDSVNIGPNNFMNGLDLQAVLDMVNRQTAEKRRARGMYR